jgi:hypothetical protein
VRTPCGTPAAVTLSYVQLITLNVFQLNYIPYYYPYEILIATAPGTVHGADQLPQ